MKKYILSIITLLLVTFPMTGFAISVNLDLFDGDLSILDSLLLIAIGITIIGFLLICIAMFKPVKEVPEYEEYEEYEEDEDYIQEASSDEYENESAVTEERDEEVLPNQENDRPVEMPIEDDADEDIVYSKLTLTGVNNDDFKVAPLKDITTFGRRKTNDVIFSDISISGEHGVITVEDGKVYISDRNSTNGTYLNGKRIDEKTEIHKGDIITLGQLEYRIGL